MLWGVKEVERVKGAERVKGVYEVKGVKRNVALAVKGNDAEIRMDMIMAQSHFS